MVVKNKIIEIQMNRIQITKLEKEQQSYISVTIPLLADKHTVTSKFLTIICNLEIVGKDDIRTQCLKQGEETKGEKKSVASTQYQTI